ncbi:MAG: collagen binding domain-containing protein, partial [Tissierellaceae bacterium]
MYHKKTKYRIVLVVVLAMLLQIIGPVAQTAYAEIMESKAFSFQIVGQEDGSGRYEWSYNPEKAKGKTEFEIKLRQKLVMDFSDLLIDSETGEVVGEFTISKDGILTARIYEVEVELEPEEIPEEPVEEEEEVEGEGEEEAEDEGQADEAGEPDEDDEEDPEQEIEDDIVEEEGFKDEADKIEINDITVQIDQDVKVTVTAKVTGVEENQKARVEILNHEGLVVEVKEELEVEGEQLIAEFDSLGPDRFQARVTVGEVVGLSEEFDLVEAEEETSEDEEVEDNGEDGEEVADEAEEDLGDKELSFFGKSIASLAMAWGNLENLFLAGADPDEEPLEPSSGGGMIPFGFMIMGGEDDGDLGNIFTDVSLEVDINDSGTFEKIDEDTNKRLEITEDTAVLLKYSWELENSVDLQDRDYSSIQIPNVFSGFIGALTGNLIATVDGTMNVIVGGFEIAGSTLTATFNNMLVGKEDRFGEVWAYFKFDPVVLNENAYQVIKFEDNINKEFIITAVPKGGSANITKAGSPDKELNASYISWSIDVNVKLEDLENGKIVDLIPEGLGEAYEVKIYDLTIGADGSIGQYLSETNPQPSYTSAGNKLTVNLGETNTAYRIEYKTKILDHSLATGKENIAHLIDKDDEYNPLGTGKWEVQQLEVGSTIDKEGSANNSGTNSDKITWTIDVNKAQLDLENVSVEDTFTEKTGHTLNISEIRIFKINEKGVVKGGNIASEYSNPTSFPITLGNLKNQAIRIEYDTSIIYNEYKSKDNIFKNQATLKLNGTQSGSPVEAEVNVSRLTLIEKNGVEGTAYDAPYIDWTIHVNKAKHTIKSATVTDVIGAGLKLDGEIKVYVGDSNTEYDSGKYTVNPKTDNGFKVTFTDSPITDYYTIKYRTKITNPGESLKNEAELYGNGLVGDGVGVDPDLGIIKTGEIGPSNTVNNSYTKSTYDSTTPIDGVTYGGLNHTDKTMSWKLIVDAKKEVVTELTISEIFDPANTMVFLEDSLRVRKGSSDILTKDTDYTLTDNKAGGFVLEFIGDHKPLERDKYEIYYKTSFDPNVILTNGGSLNNSKTYKNTVSFVGKTKDITNVETVEKILGTDTKQYDINDVVSKGGKKDGVLDRPNRKISWKVYANALSQDLSGTEFVITDTLSPFKYDSSGDGKSGHELDGAIVVKTYSLNKDGTINPGSEITSGYTITYKDVNGDNTTDPSEAKQFIISFAGGVDKPIMIEYNTKITGISANKYYNSATITGKDGLNKTYEDDVTYDNHSVFIEKTTPATEVFTDDEIEWELTLNKSLSEIDAGAEVKDILSDGLVYLSGSLAIKDYSNNPLIEGSDYSFNSTGNTLTITFTNKMTEMYTITYKTAVIAGKGVNITNNASFQGESTKVTDSSGKTFEVKQYSGGTGSGVSRGSIKIIKVDANDSSKKLKDAEFEIYYLLNGEKQIVKDSGGNDIHKTDNNGEIFVKGLVFKEYFIKEIKAPTGYVLNTTDTVSRVLSLGVSTQDIELPFENTSKANAKGKIKFIKHGGNSTPLDGAEFTLYTEDGSTPVKDSGGNNIVATSNADGEVEFAD